MNDDGLRLMASYCALTSHRPLTNYSAQHGRNTALRGLFLLNERERAFEAR
jgi:hypothetical protein